MSTNTALGSNFDGSYKCGIAISPEEQDIWTQHLAASGYDFTTKSLSPATMLLTVAVPPAALQDFRALVAGILYHCHSRKEKK